MGANRTARCVLGLALLVATLGCGRDEPSANGPAGEYRERAARLESSGDPVAAFDAYRDAARRFPTEPWPWSGLGRSAMRLGRTADAHDAFESAIRWDSTAVDERVALAELSLEAERPADALSRIDDAIRVGGETAERLAVRARCLAAMDRRLEASHAVDRARSLDPLSPDVAIAAAFVRLPEDAAGAIDELDTLVAAQPDDFEVWNARATAKRRTGDVAGAIADYEHALSLDEYGAAARRELATLLANEGRTDDAREHFRRLLEDNPRDARSLEGLGRCALAGGDRASAEAAFRQAIESDSEFAPAYLGLGRFVLADGRVDEAVSLFRKARARAATTPSRWEECSVALADAYFAANEPENALEIADAILARDAESEAGRALRGRALASEGGTDAGAALERMAQSPTATRDEVLAYAQWLLDRRETAKARTTLERYLDTHDGDAAARVLHAQTLAASGNVDAAEIELLDVLDSDADSELARLGLARLYLKANRIPDAIFHATEGARVDPANPDFAGLLGTAHLADGDPENARAAFEREARLRPETPGPWTSLGELELQLGQPEQAIEFLEKARDLSHDEWRPPYLLGLAYAAVGRPLDAIEAYRLVLARNERVVEAHNNLAWILADSDLDPVLAEVHARRAAELDPENANVLGTLGWALCKNRKYDEATDVLQKAVKLAPKDAMKHELLGEAEFGSGRRDEARRAVQAALELDPSFPRAAAARNLLEKLQR